MRKKRNNNNQDDNVGSPAWMTTFGDLMTLLLVFFVLLYSFSVMDLEKFEGFIAALQNQLGIMDGGKTISEAEVIDQGLEEEDFNPDRKTLNPIMRKLQEYINENQLREEVNLELNDRGLVIRLTGKILYDIGEAELKPKGKELLDEVVHQIKPIPNKIAVEGHTDDWPINTAEYPSNWELSTDRAVRVIKYFIEELEVDPKRLSAAGYSKYQPLKENNSVENRAANRRVEIVILRTETENSKTGSE